MKISKIYIKNYRAIDEIELNPCSDINLLYGINGTGKSSIIYALNDLFIQINNKEIKSRLPDLKFMLDRVREHDEDSIINVEFDDGLNIISIYNETKIREYPDGESYQNILVKNDNLFIATNKKKSAIKFNSFIPNITCDDVLITGDTGSGDRTNMENIVPFNLNVIKRPIFVPGRGVFYERCKKMFREREDLERQEIVESNNNDYRDPVLEKIRSGLKEIFGFTGIRVERKESDRPLKVEKDGIWLRLDSQLSSGEANIVALLASIALEVATSNSRIILIDEIDNSLHPQAQDSICGALRRLYPDVQFIISSHSPFIWGGVNKEQIIFLDRDKENNNKIIRRDVDYAIGGSIEDICVKYFELNIYNRLIDDEIKTIEDLIEQKKNEEASQKIESMRDRFGNLPIFDVLKFRMRFHR